MHGDLCASIFNRVLALSRRQRDQLYGGSVLLLGVLEGRGLPIADSNGLSDPYCTITPLDDQGKELVKEKKITRTCPKTLDPKWDEVHAFGQGVDVAEYSSIKIKVKDWDLIGNDDHLGDIVLTMDEIRKNTMASPDGTYT